MKSKFPTSWFQHVGHKGFLQGDTIIIDGHGHNFAMSQKEVRDGVHFLYADKHQSFYLQTEAATGGVL